jgi:hypothetical protein
MTEAAINDLKRIFELQKTYCIQVMDKILDYSVKSKISGLINEGERLVGIIPAPNVLEYVDYLSKFTNVIDELSNYVESVEMQKLLTKDLSTTGSENINALKRQINRLYSDYKGRLSVYSDVIYSLYEADINDDTIKRIIAMNFSIGINLLNIYLSKHPESMKLREYIKDSILYVPTDVDTINPTNALKMFDIIRKYCMPERVWYFAGRSNLIYLTNNFAKNVQELITYNLLPIISKDYAEDNHMNVNISTGVNRRTIDRYSTIKTCIPNVNEYINVNKTISDNEILEKLDNFYRIWLIDMGKRKPKKFKPNRGKKYSKYGGIDELMIDAGKDTTNSPPKLESHKLELIASSKKLMSHRPSKYHSICDKIISGKIPDPNHHLIITEYNSMSFQFNLKIIKNRLSPEVVKILMDNITGSGDINVVINGMINSPINGMINGMINSHINAPINGMINAPINGMINSPINSHINAPINGMINAPINGMINSPINPHINAPINSPINSHINAPINSHINTHTNPHPYYGQADAEPTKLQLIYKIHRIDFRSVFVNLISEYVTREIKLKGALLNQFMITIICRINAGVDEFKKTLISVIEEHRSFSIRKLPEIVDLTIDRVADNSLSAFNSLTDSMKLSALILKNRLNI